MKKIKKEYILILFLILFFAFLTICVILEKTTNIDKNIYNFIINFKNNYLTSILKIFTNLGNEIFTVIVLVILFVIFLLRKKLNLYKYIIINVSIGALLMQLIKSIIRRPRPIWKWIIQGGFSYPSGHTITAFLLYGTLIIIINYVAKSKIKYLYNSLLASVIILIGLSRIYFGAHYLTDVLAAIALAGIILIISSIFIKGEIYDKNKNRKAI